MAAKGIDPGMEEGGLEVDLKQLLHEATTAQVVHCVHGFSARTYREELHAAWRLADAPLPERLHLVVGGSRNTLLNRRPMS